MIQSLPVDSPPQSLQIPGGVIAVAPSKIFTYPTRLANAWEAQSLTIEQPARRFERRSIEMTAQPNSTRSLGIQFSNPYRRIYKTFATPIQCGDDAIFETRDQVDTNIAQILGGVAVKALIARSTLSNLTLILRENPHPRAIEVYRLLDLPVICTNREVEGNLVTLSPQCRNQDFEPFYRSTFAEFAFEGYRPDTPERVFISRHGSLINEAEIEQTLQRYGFQKLYFEDLPIHEQWSIARNAKVVVGVHSAALKNLVFNPQGVKLIELFHPGYVVDHYRRENAVLGGAWCSVTGQLSDDIIRRLDIEGDARSFATASFTIDPGSLKLALNYLDVN